MSADGTTHDRCRFKDLCIDATGPRYRPDLQTAVRVQTDGRRATPRRAAYTVNMSQFASEGSQAANEEVAYIGASPDDPAPGGDDSSIKDPSDWVSGDDPITDSQRSYLDSLARQAGETLPADLNKAQASEHIDRLRSQLNLSSD